MRLHICHPDDIKPSVDMAESLPADEIELIMHEQIENDCLTSITRHILSRDWMFTARRSEGDFVHRFFEHCAVTQSTTFPTPDPMDPDAVLVDPFRPGQRVPIGPEVAGWLADADRVDARNARHAMVEKYLVTGEQDPTMPIGILTHLSPVRDYIEGNET